MTDEDMVEMSLYYGEEGERVQGIIERLESEFEVLLECEYCGDPRAIRGDHNEIICPNCRESFYPEED